MAACCFSDRGLTIHDGSFCLMGNGDGSRMTDEIWQEVASQVMMKMMCCLGGGSGVKWSWALTLAMGEEVVSERGGGAGVTISGAHTVTAQGGAELLHACQSLCREGDVWGRGQKPSTRQQRYCGEEIEGEKVRAKRKGRYTGFK